MAGAIELKPCRSCEEPSWSPKWPL